MIKFVFENEQISKKKIEKMYKMQVHMYIRSAISLKKCVFVDEKLFIRTANSFSYFKMFLSRFESFTHHLKHFIIFFENK